jgi:hypothetical protein
MNRCTQSIRSFELAIIVESCCFLIVPNNGQEIIKFGNILNRLEASQVFPHTLVSFEMPISKAQNDLSVCGSIRMRAACSLPLTLRVSSHVVMVTLHI